MRRITIVEDQPSLCRVMERLLELEESYETTSYNNGLEAYLQVCQNRPDLLVLDILLPGLNGLAVARLLRFSEDFKDLPMLVVSSINEGVADLALAAGASAFLGKPFEPDEFLEHVARLSGAACGAKVPLEAPAL